MNNSSLYQRGKEYAENDQLDMAYQYYLEAIMSEDDGEAYYALSEMYYNGEYVSQSYDKAGYYVGMAYDRGVMHHSWTLIIAGSVHEHDYHNNKREEDLEKAIRYYGAAAENGTNHGYECLGYLYSLIGEYQKAINNLKKADGKNTLGYYAMARIYDEGLGVEKDRNRAIELYQRTVELWKPSVKEYGVDRWAMEAEKRLKELGIM